MMSIMIKKHVNPFQPHLLSQNRIACRPINKMVISHLFAKRVFDSTFLHEKSKILKKKKKIIKRCMFIKIVITKAAQYLILA